MRTSPFKCLTVRRAVSSEVPASIHDADFDLELVLEEAVVEYLAHEMFASSVSDHA